MNQVKHLICENSPRLFGRVEMELERGERKEIQRLKQEGDSYHKAAGLGFKLKTFIIVISILQTFFHHFFNFPSLKRKHKGIRLVNNAFLKMNIFGNEEKSTKCMNNE